MRPNTTSYSSVRPPRLPARHSRTFATRLRYDCFYSAPRHTRSGPLQSCAVLASGSWQVARRTQPCRMCGRTSIPSTVPRRPAQRHTRLGSLVSNQLVDMCRTGGRESILSHASGVTGCVPGMPIATCAWQTAYTQAMPDRSPGMYAVQATNLPSLSMPRRCQLSAPRAGPHDGAHRHKDH